MYCDRYETLILNILILLQFGIKIGLYELLQTNEIALDFLVTWEYFLDFGGPELVP